MEGIRGKQRLEIDLKSLPTRIAPCDRILLDLGTGDGRFVHRLAVASPAQLAIGVDTCRENVRARSRRSPANAVYLIADACRLPANLVAMASHITINFPWGSLLAALLDGDSELLKTLRSALADGTPIAITLNAGALNEQGYGLAAGVERVLRGAEENGLKSAGTVVLDAPRLRAIQTSWARRLAFGRDPRAVQLRLQRPTAPTLVGEVAGPHWTEGVLQTCR